MITMFRQFVAVLVLLAPPHAMAAAFNETALERTVSVLPDRTGVGGGQNAQGNRPQEPEGSGVAVFNGTYIATAAHVLSGAQEIHVRLYDGRILPAEIVGQDRFTDIALLRIPSTIPPFSMSDTATLGEEVCTIGNQFGLGLSVTCGVVSAVHRSNTGFNPIEDFIQTDAVVNPGASGGALVNSDGNLVGMLSGIFTKDSDADLGVNFAVHARFLVRVLDDLRDHGRVTRAKSGMVVSALSVAEREIQTGVRVMRVASDGPAFQAGLRSDDVIVTMAGRHIRYPSDVSAIVYGHKPGDTLSVTLVRENDNQISLDLVLGE